MLPIIIPPSTSHPYTYLLTCPSIRPSTHTLTHPPILSSTSLSFLSFNSPLHKHPSSHPTNLPHTHASFHPSFHPPIQHYKCYQINRFVIFRADSVLQCGMKLPLQVPRLFPEGFSIFFLHFLIYIPTRIQFRQSNRDHGVDQNSCVHLSVHLSSVTQHKHDEVTQMENKRCTFPSSLSYVL